jgi:hypothetical protein
MGRRHVHGQLIVRYLLVALSLWAGACAAQPRYGLSPPAYEVFARWMTTTCVGDEAERWDALLLRHRAELATAFTRALADGPPEDLVVRTRRAADARYAAIATARPAEVRIEGLTVRSIARPVRQSYVDGEATRFVNGYRSNAIAGLAIVGGPDARATLRRLADRPDGPLAAAAGEALKTMAVR